MTNFRKNKSKNLFSQILFKIGAVLIIIVAVFIVIADIKIYKKKQQLNSQMENLKNKIDELKSENKKLEQDISSTDDAKYIEKVAREELNLQKPGEKVISFIATENESEQNSESKKGFLEIWLGWILGWFKK